MIELRIALLIAGVLLILAIWYFSRRPFYGSHRGFRRAPSVGSEAESDEHAPDPSDEPAAHPLGQRSRQDFEKIITLHVVAKPGQTMRGTDILVAAEKTGLTYGHLDIFHRLLLSAPERGPIFSVANLQTPNSFPMAEIQTLETSALVFFLTLPAPIGALDAWDAMLPCAQRLAELLDAVVLDEQRNALNRQHIVGLRDELRAFDRQRANT